MLSIGIDNNETQNSTSTRCSIGVGITMFLLCLQAWGKNAYWRHPTSKGLFGTSGRSYMLVIPFATFFHLQVVVFGTLYCLIYNKALPIASNFDKLNKQVYFISGLVIVNFQQVVVEDPTLYEFFDRVLLMHK